MAQAQINLNNANQVINCLTLIINTLVFRFMVLVKILQRSNQIRSMTKKKWYRWIIPYQKYGLEMYPVEAFSRPKSLQFQFKSRSRSFDLSQIMVCNNQHRPTTSQALCRLHLPFNHRPSFDRFVKLIRAFLPHQQFRYSLDLRSMFCKELWCVSRFTASVLYTQHNNISQITVRRTE